MKLIAKSTARQMTGIQWTDFTGNAWTVCTRMPASSGAQSGCDICYAAEFVQNRLGYGWGAGVPRVSMKSFESRMHRLNPLARETGCRFSVFALSLGDWLDGEAPALFRASMIDTVEACTNLNWLLLTHRPHLAKKLVPAHWITDLPAHVWPGVTVDHPLHGFRWDQLRAVWGGTGRAWVSAEPLSGSLASLDLSDAAVTIYGGASGTRDAAWAFDPAWVEEHVARYGAARTFFKQHGDFLDGVWVGKKAAGRHIAGKLYDNTPWPRHRQILAAAALDEVA
jgi:protein gp37